MNRSIYLFIFVFAFMACTSTSSTTSNEISETNEIDTNDETTSSLYFNQNKDFEILNIQQNNDYPSSITDAEICTDWEMLTSETIQLILKNVKPIDNVIQHHLYDHLPCQIIGTIKQDGKEYDLTVNSGAWLTVSSTDTTLIFGNYDTTYNKYFLSTVMEEEH